VLRLTIEDERITEIDVVAGPRRLVHIDLVYFA